MASSERLEKLARVFFPHAPLCVAAGVAKELGVVGLVALPAGDDGDMDAHAGLRLVPILLRSPACRTRDNF